jgi:hypothetical protein
MEDTGAIMAFATSFYLPGFAFIFMEIIFIILFHFHTSYNLKLGN